MNPLAPSGPPCNDDSMRTFRSLISAVLLCVAMTLSLSRVVAETPAQTSSPTTAPSVYTYVRHSRDGIGKVYMGREIAHVMGHLGAGWLERPEREREEAPSKAIELMELRPTDVVAD